MGEIAILHAADSRAFACRLSSELAAEGHSVLRRESEAPTGAIDPATKAEAVVVVWSAGMLKNAPMIEAARRALARRALAPVRIGGIDPPSSFAHLWPIDLDGWNGDTADPRWQFVRDEIALAMRRSEIALSTSQIVRPPALRRLSPTPRWRRAGGAFSKAPIRLIAPGAASLAIVATVAVIVTAQQSETNAAPQTASPMVAYLEPVRPTRDDAVADPAVEVPPPPLRAGEATVDGDFAGSAVAVSAEEEAPIDAYAESASAPFPDETGAPAPELAAGGPETSTLDASPGAAESDEPLVLASLSVAVETAAPPIPPKDDYAGVVFRDCYDCPDMTAVPAAKVALSRREVTFAQWGACVREKACRPIADDGSGSGARPVVNVSHEDALGYARWLSGKTGWDYRLPTEAEWALAAGAEKTNVSPTTANYAAAPWKAPLPAGSFKASGYGLFDMRGNVWEWTADCAAREGDACKARVLKGGAFDSAAALLAADARWSRGENARAPNIGLRVARDTP